MEAKPLVVLLGWMGSQPKQLRHYSNLYQELGFRAVTFIASPSMVVSETLNPEVHVRIPERWTSHTFIEGSLPETVQGLAWRVLYRIRQLNPHGVVFHIFSNGGCFVWENLRRILDHEIGTCTEERGPGSSAENTILLQIRLAIRGVVFDSCPGSDLHRISEALEYCTLQERAEILIDCGINNLSDLTEPSVQQRLAARSKTYMDILGKDRWVLPQLYVYSVDDPLAKSSSIDALIESREECIGKHMIMKKRWGRSFHCSHLREHPAEYRSAVKAFVSMCLRNNTRARL